MHHNNKIVWTNVFQAHAQEPPSAPTHAKKCFPVLQSLAATPWLAEQNALDKAKAARICDMPRVAHIVKIATHPKKTVEL